MSHDHISQIANLICLVYHEARNIKQRCSSNAAQYSKYRKFWDLPEDRHLAWHQMRKLRDAGSLADNINDIEKLFDSQFHSNLADLKRLFNEPMWNRSKYGGKKWVNIVESIIHFTGIISQMQEDAIDQQLKDILDMRHNSGTVSEKLDSLNGDCK